MGAGQDFLFNGAFFQVDYRHASFVSNESHWIDADFGASSGGAR